MSNMFLNAHSYPWILIIHYNSILYFKKLFGKSFTDNAGSKHNINTNRTQNADLGVSLKAYKDMLLRLFIRYNIFRGLLDNFAWNLFYID